MGGAGGNITSNERNNPTFGLLSRVCVLVINYNVFEIYPVLATTHASKANCGAAAVKLRGFRMTSTISLKSLFVSSKDI